MKTRTELLKVTTAEHENIKGVTERYLIIGTTHETEAKKIYINVGAKTIENANEIMEHEKPTFIDQYEKPNFSEIPNDNVLDRSGDGRNNSKGKTK